METGVAVQRRPKKFHINARHFFLTYPRCTVARDRVLEVLKGRLDLSYCLVVIEKHEDGTPHVHVLLSVLNAIDVYRQDFFDIDNFHGKYESAKKTDDVRAYILKSDEAPLEFGEYVSNARSAVQNRLLMNKKILEEPLHKLVDVGEVSIMNYKRIKECVQLYKLDKIIVPEYLPRECIWIWGSSGIGKSRYVREHYGQSLYNKAQNKWWDGYTGEETVLIDDFDASGTCLGHHLKIWGDCYPFLGEVKGGTVRPTYTRMVITSNYQPRYLFATKDKFIPENYELELVRAIERRFKLATIDYDGTTLIYT